MKGSAYRRYYFEHCADNTRPFPGVLACLKQLAPIPLAVATTKKTYMAIRLLARLGLERRFALIQGTDEVPPKPDPSVLTLVTTRLDVSPENAWMVGDTIHDIEAARRIGMRSCAVTTGADSRAVLIAARPTLVVDTLTAFGDFLLR